MLWSAEDALRVPAGALFRGGDGAWHVFVNEHGRARERAVRIGHMNDEFAEVLRGLAAGDEVAVNPANSLRDGTPIAPR